MFDESVNSEHMCSAVVGSNICVHIVQNVVLPPDGHGDWASGKPNHSAGCHHLVALQAFTSLICVFSGLHDATASPGAAPTGFTSSRISRWSDKSHETEVAARLMAQDTLTLQHTLARDGAGGRPRSTGSSWP